MKYTNFKVLALTLASLLFITSCNNNDTLEVDTPNTAKSELLNTVFAIKQDKADIDSRAVSENVSVWNTGQTIKIKFLANAGGSNYAKQKVEEYAKEWTKYANINFDFVSITEDADIKIAFNYDNSYVAWSEIGKRATTVTNSSGKPSLSIPYYNDRDVDSKEFKAVVLRLFGHVLGLVYENQGLNAKGLYDWNESRVLTYFKQQGWTEDDIYDLMDNSYSKRTSKYTEFDEESIMLLYFPDFLTNDKKASKWNTKLSDMDIKYIQTLYPGRENGDNEIPNKMSVKHIFSGQEYDYNAVRIGEYLWLDSNLKGPIETPDVNQHQINRSLWVLEIDTLKYTVTPADYHKYIGAFFAHGSRLSQFTATNIVEMRKTGNVEKVWGLPKREDLRQLFAMCTNGKDSYFPNDVLMNLSYKEGEISIAKRVPNNHWMHTENTNKYGFNLVYAGYRQHAGENTWLNVFNNRSIVTRQGDVAQVFNMHAFATDDGVVFVHDFPDTRNAAYDIFWWLPVRLSRRLTDAELGYKLYINAAQTDIKKLPLTETAPNGYVELGHGYLRGFYVHYIIDGANPTMTVSDMKAQALSLTDVTQEGAPIIN